MPIEKLDFGLKIIFIGISYSVISNFIISMNGSDGYDYLVEYNTKLRPSVFNALSRTGDYFRVGGYTGSYHDSANVLGMLTNLFYFRTLLNYSEKRKMYFLFAIISFVAMLMTQSAANILLAMFTMIIFTFCIIKNKTAILTLIFFILAIILLALSIPEIYVFTNRVGVEGDWSNMLNKISIDILIDPYFWFGHGYLDTNEAIETEVALLKGIFQFGILPAIILYSILIYPLYLYITNKNKLSSAIPYLAALLFGFLSLAHYGSLFRISSIVIFYAIYSMFINNIKHQILN